GVGVAGAGATDGGPDGRVAVGGDDLAHAVERPRLDAPGLLAAVELGGDLGDRLGGEGRGDPGLLVALGAVVEHGPGGLDGGGGVGQVVGDDLVVVDGAGGGEVGPALLDDGAGGLGGGRGGLEVGGAHGAEN